MMDWLRFWDFTLEDWAGMQFAVLFVAAAVAVIQLQHARRLREEQARPFVVIDVELRNTVLEFVITNFGRTIARDVTFTFDPPLASTRDSGQGPAVADLPLFVTGIPSIPPGKEVRVIFDQIPARLQADLPADYSVKIGYSGPLGKRETESMVVGYGHLIDTLHLTRRDIGDVYKQLEQIAREVKRWRRQGLRIVTARDVKERLAKAQAARRRRQETP